MSPGVVTSGDSPDGIRSTTSRSRPGRSDVAPAASLALVLPLAYAPSFGSEGQAIRWAVGLLAGTVGCALLLLWPQRDLAAKLALAFLGASSLATILSPAPTASALGPGTWFVGFRAIACFVGCWVVGRVAHRDRSLLPGCLVASTALNAAAALFQALQIHPLHVPDSSDFGRAAGLVGNPVHLAALSAAGLAVASRQAGRDGRWPYFVGVAMLTAGVNLAGGRAGIATALAGLVLALWKVPPRRAAAVVACVAGGIALSVSVAGLSGSGTATGRRVEINALGRPGAWLAGLEAAAERPILGWGPGRFGAESTNRRTLESRRAELTVFEDAHNWPIEILATVGVVGLGLLLGWLAVAAFRARGPLALFALILAANGLLQPMSIAVTPLAAIALGAASGATVPPLSDLRRWLLGGTALVAAVGALMYAVGEREANRIEPTASGLSSFRKARLLLPDSPELLTSGLRAHYARGRPDDLREAARLGERITELEPGVAAHWNARAAVSAAQGDLKAAIRLYRRALVEDPWSIEALRGLASVTKTSDPATAAVACERLTLLLPRGTCT